MICITSFTNTLRQHIIDYLGINDTPQYRANIDDRIMIPDAVAYKFGKKLRNRYPKKYSLATLRDYVTDSSKFDTPHNFVVFREEDSACVAGTFQFRHDILPLRSINKPESLNDILVLKSDKRIFVFNLRRLVATFIIDDDGADIEIDGAKFKAKLASFYDMHSIISKFKIAGYDVAYAQTPLDVLKHDRVLFEILISRDDEDETIIEPEMVLLTNPTSDKFVIADTVYSNPTKRKLGRKKSVIVVNDIILFQQSRKNYFWSAARQYKLLTTNYAIIGNRLYSLSSSEFLRDFRASFEFEGKHKVVFKDTKTNETFEVNNLSWMTVDGFTSEPRIIQIDDIKFPKPIPLHLFHSFPKHIEYDTYKVFYDCEIEFVESASSLTSSDHIVIFYRDNKIIGVYTLSRTYVTDKPMSGNTFILTKYNSQELVTIEGEKLKILRLSKEVPLTVQKRIPVFKML